MFASKDPIRIEQQREGLNRSRGGNSSSSKTTGKARSARGHEGLLKGIHNAGGILQIVLAASGDKVRGKLTHHDPYTITLSVDGENVVYFKHAIESFKQVQVH